MFEGKSLKPTYGQSAIFRSRKKGASKRNMPEKQTDRTLRCRHELKYHISESKAEAIMQFIKPYLPLDRYCKLQRSRDYPIVSLYIDSTDLQLCKESLGGLKNRYKLLESAVTPTNRIIPAFLRLSAG